MNCFAWVENSAWCASPAWWDEMGEGEIPCQLTQTKQLISLFSMLRAFSEITMCSDGKPHGRKHDFPPQFALFASECDTHFALPRKKNG
jgi:hypothetical protein